MTDKYEIIAREEGSKSPDWRLLGIRKMCTLLNVSRSGYYDWKSREETETERRQKVLTRLIRAIFERSRGTYGYRRVAAELARMGRPAGEELVRKLMRRAGLKPKQVKAYKRTTIRDPDAEAAPDLVRRDFAATAPGQRLVGSGSRGRFSPRLPRIPA